MRLSGCTQDLDIFIEYLSKYVISCQSCWVAVKDACIKPIVLGYERWKDDGWQKSNVVEMNEGKMSLMDLKDMMVNFNWEAFAKLATFKIFTVSLVLLSPRIMKEIWVFQKTMVGLKFLLQCG